VFHGAPRRSLDPGVLGARRGNAHELQRCFHADFRAAERFGERR